MASVKEQIITHEGKKFKVIEVLKDEKSEQEIFFEQYSDNKYCLEAVKQDGYALSYVKDQTKEICLEAVKRNGYALRYVKEEKTFKELLVVING